MSISMPTSIPVSIMDVIEKNFVNYDNKPAVRQNNIDKTYLQIMQVSHSIASYLLCNGLNRGDRVALLTENSFEYISTYYGILSAGGVVVALNTAAKANDLCNWIEHSGASWLISAGKMSQINEVVFESPADVRCVIQAEEELDIARPVTAFDDMLESGISTTLPRLEGEDIATIIYTSGTTGHPKGVTLTHTNLLANMQSILDYMPMTENDRCLNVLPFYYSYGNSVLHTHMMKGATLILENSFMFPRLILKKMQDDKITSFSGVPSSYALLLNKTEFSKFDLSSLRYMTQAGGAMLPVHIEKLRQRLPNVEFIVMYGQTEATARITYLPCEFLDKKIKSVGKPVSGVALEIRDTHNNPVPCGHEGEVYVSGDSVMKAYWNDAELTSTVLSDGWLKTGDLATQDKEGYIYITGRKTEMIKSGAHRISPLDIEEVILRCPGVAEVAVIGQSDEILGQTIKAFVVPLKCEGMESEKIKKRDIQFHCKKYLAVYKIPETIEFLEELPKTSSGKLKRFALHDIH